MGVNSWTAIFSPGKFENFFLTSVPYFNYMLDNLVWLAFEKVVNFISLR